VRSLRVHMCDHRQTGSVDIINFELNCLAEAIRKMTKLKTLHLHGSPMFLYNFVANLPLLAPNLVGITIRYHAYESRVYFPRIPTPLRNLESLCVHPTTWDISAYVDEFKQLGQTLRRLRMANRSSVMPIVVPLAKNLTHLELLSPWGGPNETSLFQIILGNGEHIESLRLVGCPLQTHSVYFRQYPRSLPRLRDFGVRLVQAGTALIDPDFFPAICDFLRERPLLESLELTPYAQETDQTVFGFNVHVWEFISSLQHLRILSATLLDTIPHQRMVGLIPHSVKTLTVSLCDWHLEQLLQQDGWPDDLRFFGFVEHLHQNTPSLAKKIAAGVPSIRVVRVAHDYFSVTGRDDGKPARVVQWSSRVTEVFRKECLQNCGCEDYEYLYVDHDDVLS